MLSASCSSPGNRKSFKAIEKVLLINPNTVRPPVAPLGIEYLSSYLHDNGVEAAIYDLNILDERDLESAVRDYRPDITGISVRNIDDSCYATQESFVGNIQGLVSRVKAAAPKTLVVLGGVGFSILPDEILSHTGADMGIRGDGEKAMDDLALKGKKSGTPSCLDLGKFMPRRGYIDNRYYYDNGGMAGIETSRGCNRDCVYCADPIAKGRKVRLRSPKSVAREIEQLLGMGIDCFHTCDCEFNLSRAHVTSVSAEIQKRGLGAKIRWYAYCVIDGFDEKMAEAMKKAGCVGINFGADHTDEGILRFYKRRHSLDDIREAVNACKKVGIRVMLDLLLGAPGETLRTLERVLDDMTSIEPTRVGVSYGIRVYPGTEFYDYLKTIGHPIPESFLRPFFYVAPRVIGDIDGFIRERVLGNDMFFFNSREHPEKNYNYNSNEVLTHAISEQGSRGAFWDILYRKYRDEQQKKK